MSLAAKLEAAQPVRKTSFEKYVESLPEADRVALVGAARDDAWTTAALLRVLKDEEVKVSKETLANWRKQVARVSV